MTDWIITNCETVGNTHNICQDHTEYMVSNKVYVGALADGVSSNKYSDEGAAAVTRITCQEMCNNFKEYYSGKLSSKDFVCKIQDEVNRRYSKKCDINQMKSTLLVCAIYKNQYILGHIGDGAILCFGKECYVISPPQENEIGGTATYTILDYNADEHFCFKTGVIDDFDGFLLTSDGLLGNVYYSGTDIPQLAYELFGSVYKKESPTKQEDRNAAFREFLAMHIQADNEFADDCSLFMIARKEKTGFIDYEVVNGFEADVKWPCKCGNLNRMDEVRCSKCRTVYLSLYSPAIINIASKEAFFSRLNKWIFTGDNIPFDVGTTAEILNSNVFASVCDNVKNAVKNMPEEDNNSVVTIKDSVVIDESVTSALEEKNGNCEKTNNKNVKIEENGSKNGLSNVAKWGVTAVSMVKKGLKFMSDIGVGYSNHQKKLAEESSNFAIRKEFPIGLSYTQLEEAAYRLGWIPVTFVSNTEKHELTQEQLIVVDAMFRNRAFLDILQCENDDSIALHYYRTSDKQIAVLNDGGSGFACRICQISSIKGSTNILPDYMLLPQYGFRDEIAKCSALNKIAYKYRDQEISWNWYNSYRKSKGNAAKMMDIFYDILSRNKIQLNKPIANLWVIAENQSDSEMVAYLLTSCNLIVLKSLDKKTVLIDQVNEFDNSAIHLRQKYLLI